LCMFLQKSEARRTGGPSLKPGSVSLPSLFFMFQRCAELCGFHAQNVRGVNMYFLLVSWGAMGFGTSATI
jgi:hypothetical protein